MAKAYCPECKKMLPQVLSSFECLSTWDRAQDYYAPGNECKLVKRCPDCGTLAKDKEKRIARVPAREMKREMETESVRSSRLKGRPRTRTRSVSTRGRA